MENLKYGKTFICKTLKLLEYLVKRGFTPSHSMPDLNNPKYKVWAFENSPELEQAAREYFAQMKTNG